MKKQKKLSPKEKTLIKIYQEGYNRYNY